MSILTKNYEISIWRDIFVGGELKEDKLCVFGAHDMLSPFRALEPQLKSMLNGSHTFTFKLHRFIIDPVTGQKEENPFVDQLVNETKIKVNNDGKWYDLFIKNIKQDSTNSTYTYTAEDVHVNELSKLGYDVTLDDQLMNNLGTAETLAKRILEVDDNSGKGALDWSVESEELPEYHEDVLIKCTDSTGQIVYAFYSCCVEKPHHFQYLKFGREITDQDLDADRVIRKTETEYWFELPDSNGFIKVSDQNSPFYGIWFPNGWTPSETTKYRAERKVYTQLSYFNPVLNRYVWRGNIDNTYYYATYTESEYITPNLINNYVSNSTFSSTSGWKGSALISDEKLPDNHQEYFGECEAVAIISNEKGEIKELQRDYWLEGLNPPETASFSRALKFTSKKVSSDAISRCLINTGFRDNRRLIKNMAKGKQFVLLCETLGEPTILNVDIGKLVYDQKRECYRNFGKEDGDSVSYVTFKSAGVVNINGKEQTYWIGSVNDSYTMTEEDFLKSNLSIVIRYSNTKPEQPIYFTTFEIYPYVPVSDTNSTPMLPQLDNLDLEGRTVIHYKAYIDNESVKDILDPAKYVYVHDSTTPPTWTAMETTERVRSLSTKQSNYFNNIQSLCEKFECWAEFDIQHDLTGQITSKTLRLHKYVGQDNFVGIRYGINLKNVNRTLDSKSIVSRLIVTDNVNEFAKNGFCSISRAPMNFTGENVIYDFSYFVNNGLLNKSYLESVLYGDAQLLTLTPEKEVWERIDVENINQYYSKLHILNKEVARQSEIVSNYSNSLVQANAYYQAIDAELQQSQEQLIELTEEFGEIAQFSYQEINSEARKEIVQNSTKLAGLLGSISDLLITQKETKAKFPKALADKNAYEKQYSDSYDILEKIDKKKQTLNVLFIKTFGRFIQEGTWSGKDYIDDNKYFSDAQATLKDSILPKVSYTFSIIDVSGLEGYELYKLNLGDKTWAEDPEFFGYDTNGNPYREEITVTEIIEHLDSPEKNSIKVQNYRNQFQDLFQKITATTQQVQYSEGSWNKAADFTDASADTQAKFLQDALNSAELEVSNQANQSVITNKFGITVTDPVRPSEKLRITNGAIMFSNSGEDGTESWRSAITARGINANLITAGQINTSLVQVMSGDRPTFQWNQYGINAYSFKENENATTDVNRGRAVRFDQYGLYGFDITENGKEAADFVPGSEQEIEVRAHFYLGWRGLFLRPGAGKYTQYLSDDGESNEFGSPKTHVSTARFGRADEYLYNTWDEFGKAYYDTDYEETAQSFVKIMSIKRGGQEQYALYDDGTVICKKLRAEGADISGTIKAEGGRIGNWILDNGILKLGEHAGEPNSIWLSSAPYAIGNEVFVGNVFGLNTKYYMSIGDKFGVTENGILVSNGLQATKANITGTIHADEGGSLATWSITEEGILSSAYYSYTKGDNTIAQDTVFVGLRAPVMTASNYEREPVLLFAGARKINGQLEIDAAPFRVTSSGNTFANVLITQNFDFTWLGGIYKFNNELKNGLFLENSTWAMDVGMRNSSGVGGLKGFAKLDLSNLLSPKASGDSAIRMVFGSIGSEFQPNSKYAIYFTDSGFLKTKYVYSTDGILVANAFSGTDGTPYTHASIFSALKPGSLSLANNKDSTLIISGGNSTKEVIMYITFNGTKYGIGIKNNVLTVVSTNAVSAVSEEN